MSIYLFERSSSPWVSVAYREWCGMWSDTRPFWEGLDILFLSQIPLGLTLIKVGVSKTSPCLTNPYIKPSDDFSNGCLLLEEL